jgi:hypothetical protein
VGSESEHAEGNESAVGQSPCSSSLVLDQHMKKIVFSVSFSIFHGAVSAM